MINSFKKMPRSQKMFTGAMLLLLLAVYFVSEQTFEDQYQYYDASDDEYANLESEDSGYRREDRSRMGGEIPPIMPTGSADSRGQEFQGQRPNQGVELQRVVIHDQGLQLPLGAMYIPQGWQLQQDIAHNPADGAAVRFRLDIIGTKGELVRSAGSANYSAMMGQNFQQALHQKMMQVVGNDLQQVQFGQLQPSQLLAQSKSFRRSLQRFQSRGIEQQALEVYLQGVRQGRPYRGVFYITHYIFPNAGAGSAGNFSASLVLAPQEHFESTLDLNYQLSENFEENPQYEQAMMHAINMGSQQRAAATQASAAAHQRKMAANQAQFDAHQQKMKGIYQSNDQQNTAWLNNFRGGNTTGSTGSGYSSHDAYIDGIHGRSSFDDPSTGQRKQMDGNYNYNFTDNQGNYVGSDNPNLNPHGMPGDWQEVSPLRPNQ